MKIEFKNGSKIESIDCYEGKRGNRSAIYYIAKPRIRDRWLDFILRIKSLIKQKFYHKK